MHPPDVKLHCMFPRPDAVRRSSPLLYSTVLAIALRFTSAPDEKYQRMLAAARDGVLSVLADNLRSEETIMALCVHAYVRGLSNAGPNSGLSRSSIPSILQTEFKGIHDEGEARTDFERDLAQLLTWPASFAGSYLMLGMAIRIGMDMDIGRPLPHLDDRRNRSRTRCWIGLFNADRRFGGCGQVQKPEIMPEDAVIRASCVRRLADPTFRALTLTCSLTFQGSTFMTTHSASQATLGS